MDMSMRPYVAPGLDLPDEIHSALQTELNITNTF